MTGNDIVAAHMGEGGLGSTFAKEYGEEKKRMFDVGNAWSVSNPAITGIREAVTSQ